jgi:hypothetical protein
MNPYALLLNVALMVDSLSILRGAAGTTDMRRLLEPVLHPAITAVLF